ncbi:MAG: sel1 repeat family protein [Deltaproteobacteria bacterium]|nr:sel1 repeat family protein [Deltaproteobacteria bacterium]MBN2670444.1 sel1 repeat family protein [Deltaproteobacteria bacterium]
MHRVQRLLIFNLTYIFILGTFGCVSKPPVAEISDDSEIIVGTPGSVGFPEQQASADTDNAEEDSAPGTGCTHDNQCKGDRVCIAGTCVSPQYADEYEARYMASAGVTQSVTPMENSPIIDVEVPPVPKKKLRCQKRNVTRCMKKCDKGDMDSCFAVGRIYETFEDEPNHVKFSLYAYRKACDGGHAVACVVLSRMYFSGTLVERNYGIAFSLNVDGCALQNMYACANAALFLENGIGTDRNPGRAAEYYANACIFGHDASCAKAKPTDE